MALRGKLDMVDIQNASLAGGVAVGASADFILGPWGAILLGSVVGGISTWGFTFLSPFLENTIGLHDTAGINNLHGMPAIIGGLAGIFSSLNADPEVYFNIGKVFPCRAPSNATLAAEFGIPPGQDWSNLQQASAQASALFTSLGIGLTSGVVVGALLKYCTCFTTSEDLFSRHDYFTEFFVNVSDEKYPFQSSPNLMSSSYVFRDKNKADIDDVVVQMPNRVEKKRSDRSRKREDGTEDTEAEQKKK